MDFNIAPYNDDFNKKNNYYKVLHKPGYAVQARELNTAQSILQDQIASIGNHLFKNGAKITGCANKFMQYDYVRLKDIADGKEVNLSPFKNTKIKLIGTTSKVEAQLIDTTEKDDNDPATLYVNYTKTGIDNKQSTFVNGEDIDFYDINNVLLYTVTVRCPTCPETSDQDKTEPCGKSLFYRIESGVFYYNGFFVNINDEHIITEKYLTKDSSGGIVSSLTYQVGLNVVEEIITAEDDVSLYDPHLGYPNFAGEGADRYKIDMHLAMRSYSDESTASFIMLAKVRQNATVEYKKDDTEYGQIMGELARRTYETSGDFTVNAWTVKFLNEKKDTEEDTLGWSTTGNDNNYVTVISTGTGYVKGYRVGTSAETIVSNSKARDTKKLRGATVSFNPRPNILVETEDNATIGWINNSGNTTQSTQPFNIFDDSNIAIGTFKVYDIVRQFDNKYMIYLYDLKMVEGKTLSLGKTIKTTDNSFKAKVSDTLTLENANNNSLIFPLGYNSVKTIRDNDNTNNGNTTLEVRKRLVGQLDSNGTITFNASTNESFISPLVESPLCWVGSTPNGLEVKVTSKQVDYQPTTLTLKLGSSYANQSITYICSVVRTNQQEDTKTLTNHTYTTDDSPKGAINDVIVLKHADGYKLTSVKLVSKSDDTINIDVTDEYDFFNGQTDNYYGAITLTRNKYREMKNDYRLIITYYYFERSGTAGFCTVDSYQQLLNDKTLNLTYKDIPKYNDINGTEYKLAECIDFRPIQLNDTITSAYTPSFNTMMTFDVEYYLPRYDLLLVNKDGTFYYKHGSSSDNPTLPEIDENAMALYEVYQNAYVYSLNDIKLKYRDNKRFTMHDIGRMETRLSNLEYSVALSALETQTLNMDIKDSNGNNRYKNGFLVDNFKNFTASDVNNTEFKASLDRTRGRLRPQFTQNNVKLKFNETASTNIKLMGNMAIANYESDLFLNNPYATSTLSINPYMIFRRTGNLAITPNVDTWADTTQLPTVTTTIDTGVDALKTIADATKVTGTDYGSWVDYNKTILNTSTKVQTSVGTMGRDKETVKATSTLTTAQVDSSRTVTTTGISSETQSYTIDDIVKDVSISPYIRENTVQFYATNMKPNTRLYAYFDGVDVTEHCKVITQVLSTDDAVTARNKSIYGAMPMVTDAEGSLSGEFRIPSGKFFTGEKKFVLTNDPDNTGNTDVETTRSEATYFAGGINQSKQSSTLNVQTPKFTTTTSTETKSTTSTSRTMTVETTQEQAGSRWGSVKRTPSVRTTVVSDPSIPDMPDVPAGNWSSHFHWRLNSNNQWDWDPIAQGFKVDESCFISKMGVYFSSVDLNSDGVWFEIREMSNGYPTTDAISHKDVAIKDISTSDDASKEYIVEWDCPVYIDSTKSYAFVIGGYSPETRVFISTLGSKLLGEDRVLEQPPMNYTMFRSLNGETWNAQQYDTLKVNIYRCVFNTSTTKFSFDVDTNDHFSIQCENNPIEVQTGSNRVRIYAKDHGLRINDRITLTFSDRLYYTVEVTSGMPQIGQEVSTETMSGVIKDIKESTSLNQYLISFENMKGYFELGQVVSCKAKSYVYRDLTMKISSQQSVTINDARGIVRKIDDENLPKDIGGVDIQYLSREHIVKDVDSIDSFIIEIDMKFNTIGKFGGRNVYIFGNGIKYDSFNISGTYLAYNTIDQWYMKPYKFDGEYDKLTNFKPQTDTNLENPCLLLDKTNETRILGNNNHSLTVSGEFEFRSPYISPVFNVDTFSITTISNRIEYINKNDYNNMPMEAKGRFIDETDPSNGVECYKYITTKVLLDNPATDLRILFDTYCHKDADFDVYIKLFTTYGSSVDSEVEWTKFDNFEKTKASVGITDLIEYDLTMSKVLSNYKESNEYSSFRVKLIGRSSNSAKPVIFENFRAIAIT